MDDLLTQGLTESLSQGRRGVSQTETRIIPKSWRNVALIAAGAAAGGVIYFMPGMKDSERADRELIALTSAGAGALVALVSGNTGNIRQYCGSWVNYVRGRNAATAQEQGMEQGSGRV